jgi:hypothetical protein
MILPVRWFMWFFTKPKEIRPGLITSINAAYTATEVKALLTESRFTDFTVSSNPIGLRIVARKQTRFSKTSDSWDALQSLVIRSF